MKNSIDDHVLSNCQAFKEHLNVGFVKNRL